MTRTGAKATFLQSGHDAGRRIGTRHRPDEAKKTEGPSMSATTSPTDIFSRRRIIAGPGFSRWMVPPAALCVHLCIGQAYAFSVFNLPMTRLLGITQSAPDDWKLTDLGWIFSIAIVFLGLRPRCSGAGWRRAARAARCSPPRCASPAASWSPPRGSSCTISAWSISATAYWAGSAWGSANLPGLDADQMVSRPARHGHRHGDHGLRRRRLHRFAAVGVADAAILHADPCRRRGDLHRSWR